MPTSGRHVITWTPARRDALRAAYTAARDAGQSEMTFDDHAFLVSYAGYLLEYLDLQFGQADAEA